MALRNISNIQQQQELAKQANIKPIYMYNLSKNQHNNENSNINKIQLQNTNGSSSTTSSGGSSIQIRTSSPISSSSSGSEISGPANTVISPSKFMKAVHMSRKNMQQLPLHPPPPPPSSSSSSSTTTLKQKSQANKQCIQHPPSIQNYVSMKELAYEKLRKQQSIEHDLKQAFNLNEMNQNERLKSNGKLKISIYNNMNHLSINIMEGRSYRVNNSITNLLDTYVKITMLPDMEKRFKKCQTNAIKPHVYEKSNGKEIYNYKYDSKYSFEFDNVNDLRNRLIISVWSILPGHSKHQTIGLFSFKIKHLMKQVQPKPVWYHLLPLKYGLTKHLKCSNSKSSTSLNNINNPEVPNVNKDIIGMDKISLTLIKQNENEGFGFTLTGSCPCMVGKVDSDKTAFKYGLRSGDYISKINNKNVSRATCESVVKLIKSCKFRLDLQVYRQNQSSKSCKNNYPKLNKIYQQIPINYNYQNDHSTTSGGSFSSISNFSTSDCDNINTKEQQFQQNEILVPIPQLQSQPSSQSNLINNFQNNLEVVLEEDEDELVDDEEDVIRHVDSFSSEINTSNEEDDDDDSKSNNDANTLRRVAAQFYEHRQHHANIMSLRSLKLNNE
jgi:hypothetical protein